MLRFFPRRAIHLDFHTSPDIHDVGRDFDPGAFAQTFVDAHVDSVTLFAKCHHGHLYYDTDRAERHPGLSPSLDLLRAQIDALHARGIKAPIYVSVQVDEYAARQHPEWCAMDENGRIAKNGGPLGAGWHTLDMSSPYQEYLAEQLAEVLERFAPTDGIFLDMCWDQPSCSRWARDGMLARGMDPACDADRQRYARDVAHAYMARFKKMVDDAHRGGAPAGIWFNSRPKTNLHVEKKFLRHVEIECLPTGGWGYAYFPYVSRFVRPYGFPTLSMTARFHKSWADFGGIKPEAALMYECCSSLSQGLSNSVGDQLHPRGTLDRGAYALIGKVYNYIQSCEPWMDGAKLSSQIGVLIDPERGDHAGPDGLGFVRALQELRHQFDLVAAHEDLRTYELVIVPESIAIDAALKKRLAAFVKAGGALIVSGAAALDAEGRPAMSELGLVAHGPSPYAVTYLRLDKAMAAGLPDTDHVMYERGLRITPAKGAKALARVVEPYFDRNYLHFCSHSQTPPDKISKYAAIVQHGRVITIASPIFTAYGLHANLAYREIVGRCIDRILPEPLIRDDGPAHLEATVARKDARTIVQLLSFYPARKTQSGGPEIIEDAFPLVNVTVSVKVDRAPKRVVMAPEETPLEFVYESGRVSVTVNSTRGHVMLVIE